LLEVSVEAEQRGCLMPGDSRERWEKGRRGEKKGQAKKGVTRKSGHREGSGRPVPLHFQKRSHSTRKHIEKKRVGRKPRSGCRKRPTGKNLTEKTTIGLPSQAREKKGKRENSPTGIELGRSKIMENTGP